ncbi:MAG: tetratricopeptide repeat protein [Opitutales bacterium]
MDNTTLQDKIDDATLDFTLGDAQSALTKLNELATTHPDSFAIWHALTEVYFSESQYDEALTAAEKALKLAPEDVHIHTSLSRIWMERGDKKKAEHHGAQARMLGWKEQLRSPEEDKDSF